MFTITPDISPQSTIIEGEIINVNNMDAVSFIEFIPYDLTVLSFTPTNKTGSARLIGKLASYDGKLEFIVDEVR